jgi:transposase
VDQFRGGGNTTQLGVHHEAVERVLGEALRPPTSAPVAAPHLWDPFVPFVRLTLERYPKLTASRLFHMVRARGYPGRSEGHFRRLVSQVRPRPSAEAFLRLSTLPGEQAQVDWAHCGRLQIGRAPRYLMAFVMVLSWSRRIFVRFFLDARMTSFLTGHTEAFELFGGTPRILLYDNLKSAVLERAGDAIRFHPTLLSLAAHHRYEPRPVAVARGNEKGRVERSIRYLRDAFLAGREIRDLDTLNAEVTAWTAYEADLRRCPGQRDLTVAQAFEAERPRLLPLPDDTFPVAEPVVGRVGKTPYTRFDGNDYSVPHDRVRRPVTLWVDTRRVRVTDGALVVAEHARSYDRGQVIETPEHIAALVQEKRAAARHRGQDRLRNAVPRVVDLLAAMAGRGQNMGAATAQLLRLLDLYGHEALALAVDEAMARDVPHPNAVRHALERRHHDMGHALPIVEIPVPEGARNAHRDVKPHDLAGYDRLIEVAIPSTTDKEDKS